VTNAHIAIGKYQFGRAPLLKCKNFSFFQDTKNGPTVITFLPLNHHIDFRFN